MKIKVRGGDELLEEGWRLINEITLTEDVAEIIINQDSEGNNFELEEFIINFLNYGSTANTNNAAAWFGFNSSRGLVSLGVMYTNTTSAYRASSIKGRKCGEIWDISALLRNSTKSINQGCEYPIQGYINKNTKITSFQFNNNYNSNVFGANSVITIYGK